MRLPVILSVYAAAFPLVSLVAPKGTVPLLVLATLVGSVAAWRERRRPLWPGRGLLIVLTLFMIWATISATWSLDTQLSLLTGAKVSTTVVTGLIFFAIAASLNRQERISVLKWLTYGVLLTLVLLTLDYALGYQIYALLDYGHQPGPLLAGHMLPPRYNRGVTALALAVWPALVFTGTIRGRIGRTGWWLLLAAVAIALAVSNSVAAFVAVATGWAMYCLSRISSNIARGLVIMVPVLLLIGSPFAAKVMRDANLQSADWLFHTAQQRVEIWGFAADVIESRPLLGWGLGGSRVISDLKPKSENTGGALMLLHPHNATLQILLELGAIGGALALAAILLVARELNRAPPPARPFLQAIYISTLTVASLSFGLWQAHWLATIFGLAALGRLTLPASDGAAQQRQTAPAVGKGFGV